MLCFAFRVFEFLKSNVVLDIFHSSHSWKNSERDTKTKSKKTHPLKGEGDVKDGWPIKVNMAEGKRARVHSVFLAKVLRKDVS